MILEVKTLSFLVTHRTNFYWCKVIENNNYCKQLWEEGKGRNSKGYMYFLVVILVLLRFPHRQSELVVPLGIVSIACINKQRIIKHTEQLQITNIACLTNNKKLYSSSFTIANSLWASCLISNTYLNGLIKFWFQLIWIQLTLNHQKLASWEVPQHSILHVASLFVQEQHFQPYLIPVSLSILWISSNTFLYYFKYHFTIWL